MEACRRRQAPFNPVSDGSPLPRWMMVDGEMATVSEMEEEAAVTLGISRSRAAELLGRTSLFIRLV